MTECYKCGISSEKAILHEGVSPVGIVNVCRKCFFKQKMPLLEHKKIEWSEVDKSRTVRQRLSRMAGIKEDSLKKEYIPTQKDQELRRLVEKNFEENKMSDSEIPEDLIPNFNWIIMRKRRALKLSLKDFANRIYVPESIADSVERGVLPREYKGLIRKIESSLDINLFVKPKFKIRPEDLAVESKVPTGALVSEIKESLPVENNMFYSGTQKTREEKVVEELRQRAIKNEEINNHEIDASDLNLDNIENLFGVPDEIKNDANYTSIPIDKEEYIPSESLNSEAKKLPVNELNEEDVKRFAWGN